MESINSRIYKARPRLSLVAPLTNAIILAFMFGNLLISYGLWILQVDGTTSKLPIINEFFSFRFYSVLFFLLSFVMFYGWWRNSWLILRVSLLFGVFLKGAWTVALIFSVIQGGSVAVFGAWLTLLIIQMNTYIYFVRPIKELKGK